MKNINHQFIEDAHQNRLKVFVFTVNSAQDIERIKALGVDGVFNDYPELAVSGLKSVPQ